MDNTKSNKILLVVEGQDLDREVTVSAASRALADNAALVLLHVIDHLLINRLKGLTQKRMSDIEIELEEKGWKALYFAEEYAKDKGISTMIIQKSGAVENEILNQANHLNANLIVLGYPRKLPNQTRRLVQTRLENIIENAQCSVLIVK